MSDQRFLVCASAENPLTVEGSSFDCRCSQCSRRVMISPSGQRRLREDPAMGILCAACFERRSREEDTVVLEPRKEQLAELNKVVPNRWKVRN